MGLPAGRCCAAPLWAAGGHTALKAALFAATAALCVAVYLGASRLLGSEELSAMVALARSRSART